MPKNYHNRLDKLEDELQTLLMLQVAAENGACVIEAESTRVVSIMREQEQDWPCTYPVPCPAGYRDDTDQQREDNAQLCYPEICPGKNHTDQDDEEMSQPSTYSDSCPAYNRYVAEQSRQQEDDEQYSYPDAYSSANNHLPMDQTVQDTKKLSVIPEVGPAYTRQQKQQQQQLLEDKSPAIEDLYIRVSNEKLPDTSERRRSSSAPADNPTSYSKQRGLKECVPSFKGGCKPRQEVPPFRVETERDVVATKFDYAIEQLRMERQQFKALQETNKKLREMVAQSRAGVKEAADMRKTSLDYSRQVSERNESTRMENEQLKRELEESKAENKRLSGDAKTLEDELSSMRQASLRSDKDGDSLKVAENRVNELEQQLKECDMQMKEMDKRFQAEVKTRREEQNTLASTIRDSETRARDAEARVKELEQRLAAAEKRADDADKKRKAAYDDLRNKETLLEQETLKRISLDENTKSELKRCEEKMSKMTERQRELEGQRDDMENQLRQAQRDVEKKCAEQEQDFQAFRESCREKEEQLTRERLDMVRIVKELTAVAEEHKNRVDELTEVAQQQDELIHSQKQALQVKDEQVRLANQEVDIVRQKSADLDMQVRSLRSSVEHLERTTAQDTTLADTQAMLQRAKKALDAERDKILIKEKIIEDQNNTIKVLKFELQDSGDDHLHDCKELEEQLEVEKQLCQKFQHELEDCLWAKQDLETRLAELENDSEDANKFESEDFTRHDHLLHQLEMQVQAKQKEWELQMQLMKQDRETASNAAKYATRKLESAAVEFRKKLDTHERVHRLLSAMLKEKDDLLAKANDKIREANTKVRQLSMSMLCRPPPPPMPPSDCECDEAPVPHASRHQYRRPSLPNWDIRHVPWVPCQPGVGKLREAVDVITFREAAAKRKIESKLRAACAACSDAISDVTASHEAPSTPPSL